MGFIERNLTSNETIVYRGKLHWLVFWKPIAITMLVILATVVTGFFTYEDNPDLTLIIGGIIILVAMFNILSCLTMLSSNKIRDIAILRTIGLNRKSILRIFIYIGSTIGLLGTTIGIGTGLLISLNIEKIKTILDKISNSNVFNEEIYFLSQLPSKVDWIEVTLICVFSLLLCFFATLYPALKASKFNPIDALRF